MMPILRYWKSQLRQQGCDLILSTTLREPVARVKSLVAYLGIPKIEFEQFVSTHRDIQTRYMMYNFCEMHSHSAIPPSRCSGAAPDKRHVDMTDVEELVGYLAEFDIVSRIEDIDRLLEESEQMTGWTTKATDKKVHANKSSLKYNITKEMEQQILSNVGLQMDLQLWERVYEQGLFI